MAVSETKTCQNCKASFVIDAADFDFYKKISVPPPTFCPECRLVRRMIWRQDRTLYKDVCDSCGKEILSVFHPDEPYTVYCSPCWWSDKWDPFAHGQDYDFSKPFFPQFRELLLKIPRSATSLTRSVDCHYCDSMVNSKNCYLCFGGYYSENCRYSMPIFSKDCMDSNLGMNMDHAYETDNADNVYNVKYSFFSEECIDSAFLFDSKGCTNCFGGVNLRSRQYHVFNKPYTKEEYKKQMAYWDLGSYAKTQEALKRFEELYYATPRRYAWTVNATNVTGENIKNSKNCHYCFSVLSGVENSKYIFISGLNLKDSYDSGFGGEKSELLYESTSMLNCSRLFFTRGASNMINAEYCENCDSSQNLFACAGIRSRKQYCIFNKQYSQSEYETLRAKIIEHMHAMPYIDNRGSGYRYGEFFPSEFSPWAYNESLAYQWFPLSKEEALQKGYRWRDTKARDHKITIESAHLPDHIKDVSDDIVNEVIGCEHKGACTHQCVTAFRIMKEDLAFYRKMNLALPRLCHNCRFHTRIRFRNPAKLWHRRCGCNEAVSDTRQEVRYKNTSVHFHGTDHCPQSFETSIRSDRREIVYCQRCYNEEFL